jgi:hypothetical protein
MDPLDALESLAPLLRIEKVQALAAVLAEDIQDGGREGVMGASDGDGGILAIRFGGGEGEARVFDEELFASDEEPSGGEDEDDKAQRPGGELEGAADAQARHFAGRERVGLVAFSHAGSPHADLSG